MRKYRISWYTMFLRARSLVQYAALLNWQIFLCEALRLRYGDMSSTFMAPYAKQMHGAWTWKESSVKMIGYYKLLWLKFREPVIANFHQLHFLTEEITSVIVQAFSVTLQYWLVFWTFYCAASISLTICLSSFLWRTEVLKLPSRSDILKAKNKARMHPLCPWQQYIYWT